MIAPAPRLAARPRPWEPAVLYSWRVCGGPGGRSGVSDDQGRAIGEVSDALRAGAGTRGLVQACLLPLSGREYVYCDVIARGVVHELTGAVMWATEHDAASVWLSAGMEPADG